MIEAVNVVAAAVAGFAFGAVWYIVMSRPWMAASGVTEAEARAAGPRPYVAGLIAMVVVAGMMRHTFGYAAIDTLVEAVVAGGGIGAFFVVPFLAMNYAFALRPGALLVIDGVNAIGACAVMGVVLVLF